MNKLKENKFVPKIRFAEFTKNGDWKIVKLGNLFSERQETGFIDLTLLSLTDKDGIIPQEYTNRKNNSSGDKSKYLRVCIGDVAYNTMRMWEGRSAFVNIEGLVSPAYTVCRPTNDNDGLFFSYYFKSPPLIHQFHRYSQGLVKDTLNLKYEVFSQIQILSPIKEEQKKIADCLSSLDNLITAENQKLEALKAHKKGLLHKLFPAAGKKVPKLRFKEFEDAGKWDSADLGRKDVSFFINEKVSFEKLRIETYVSTENILPDYAGVIKASKLPRTGAFTKFKEGDVLISNIRPYLKKVWFSNMEGAASNDVIVIRAGEKLNASFLSALLGNDEFISYVMKGAQGVKMPRGDKSLMQEYPIFFPTKAEQQIIAECISSNDSLISFQSQKIELLKEHKKGLMQQLFPNISETETV